MTSANDSDLPCASCGADLPADARFCTRCGARVELGSLLGVGTDLPPADPAPAHASAHPPVDPREDHDAQRDGTFSAGRIAAMAATFVVLTILGTFALSQLFGSGSPEPPATSASGEASPSSSPEPSPPVPSPSEPSAADPTPTPDETLPAGARTCSTSGDDAVATAYSGNKDTSCAFTNAVREAYREAGAPRHPTPFRAYSTVTKKWYDVTCGGGSLVRCASSNQAAVVFLGPQP